MIKDDCNKFNECSAPICPLSSEEENKNYTWYPDEEICTKFFDKLFIKNQKKIVKINNDRERYYTYDMLNHECIIGKGMQGLDPNQSENSQLKQWFKKHPKKGPISDKRKEIIQKMRKHKKKFNPQSVDVFPRKNSNPSRVSDGDF